MKNFGGKIAVITGGGSGMGRALAIQLATEGCSVALCDVSAANMLETERLCREVATRDAKIATFVADVSKEASLVAFADHVRRAFETDHIDLMFNNAGIGSGGSIVDGDRGQWERTFAVTWSGVYLGTLAFLPLMLKSADARLINTSSINGIWASVGPSRPYSAYSTAKFAVRGFTEALINDFAANAPNIKCHVVMPGHIGTDMISNSAEVLSNDSSGFEMSAVREVLSKFYGRDLSGYTDEQVMAFAQEQARKFRDDAPTSASQAARIILDGIRADRWRILVGEDARYIDEKVRTDPENAYTQGFYDMVVAETNWGV